MAVDPACLCLMLAAVIFWLYSPAIRFGFTHYDDLEYFAQNPHVSGRTGMGWNVVAFRSAVVSNWHPLTMLSFMLDATMAGTLDPSVPHFTNILLHAINSVLLFLLLQYLTGRQVAVPVRRRIVCLASAECRVGGLDFRAEETS